MMIDPFRAVAKTELESSEKPAPGPASIQLSLGLKKTIQDERLTEQPKIFGIW